MKQQSQTKALLNRTLKRMYEQPFEQGDLNKEVCQLGTIRDPQLQAQYLEDVMTCA